MVYKRVQKNGCNVLKKAVRKGKSYVQKSKGLNLRVESIKSTISAIMKEMTKLINFVLYVINKQSYYPS